MSLTNWQEWAVALVIVLCVLRIAYWAWQSFRRTRDNDNPCAHCTNVCELKRQLDKQREKCNKEKGKINPNNKSSKKNCCG